MTQELSWGLLFKVRALTSGTCIESRGVGGKCAEGYCIYGDIYGGRLYSLSGENLLTQWSGQMAEDGSWATHHCKHLSWGRFYCEGCYGEHSDTREGLGRMTSLVTDPDAMGHTSSPISVCVLQAGCFPSLSPSFQRLIKLSLKITMDPSCRIFSNSSSFCPSPPPA